MASCTEKRIKTPQIIDWSGNKKSLSYGSRAYIYLNAIISEKNTTINSTDYSISEENAHCSSKKKLLILGLGINCPDISAEYDEVFYVECPDFEKALDFYYENSCADNLIHENSSRPVAPKHYERILPEQAIQMCRYCNIMFYRQNLRLFPDFWGDLWGKIEQRRLLLMDKQANVPNMLILGDNDSLLTRELIYAFEAQGFKVHCIDAALMLDKDKKYLTFLKDTRPDLVFAVNAQGFDTEGELFYLLSACNIPVVFWFTDNPWLILTRFKTAWWQKAFLYCTDHSFIPALKKLAKNVEHLPLAFAPHMWLKNGAEPLNNFADNMSLSLAYKQNIVDKRVDFTEIKANKILFLGSLAFPAHKSFFAAAKISDELLKKAISLLNAGAYPDFNWWAEQLNVTDNMWPGNYIRSTGLGAGLCNAYNRLFWLGSAYNSGLSFFGHSQDELILQNILLKLNAMQDNNMLDLLPKLIKKMQAPVDYYTILPLLYALAPYTLNVTSLLLPSGLTQRHFDVWASGGFLLTNITAGLQIFPKELTEEISLAQPKDMAIKIKRFEAQPSLRKDLQYAWRKLLQVEHSYEKRIEKVCNEVLNPAPKSIL